MPKFQYKLKNIKTGKFWSVNQKASWLQKSAITYQISQAAARWGIENVGVMEIPLEETPLIPASEFMAAVKREQYDKDKIKKFINDIIRKYHSYYGRRDEKQFNTYYQDSLRRSYKVSHSIINRTTTDIGIKYSFSVMVNGPDETFPIAGDVEIKDPEYLKQVAINKAALDKAAKDEHELYLKLKDKFEPKS